jgi:hypothetical protein
MIANVLAFSPFSEYFIGTFLEIWLYLHADHQTLLLYLSELFVISAWMLGI